MRGAPPACQRWRPAYASRDCTLHKVRTRVDRGQTLHVGVVAERPPQWTRCLGKEQGAWFASGTERSRQAGRQAPHPCTRGALLPALEGAGAQRVGEHVSDTSFGQAANTGFTEKLRSFAGYVDGTVL
jgi:hypothetical protein